MKFLFLLFFSGLAVFAQGFTPTPTQTGASGAVPTASCVGTPGNTIGAYKSQCQATNGNVYACNNSADCTVAADWVQIGGGATGQPAAPLNSLQINAGGGNFGPATVGTNYQGPTTQVVGQGTVNTNLANTISNCTSTPCYVVIPANYGGGEQLSTYGFSGDITQSDSSSLPINISVFDLRSNASYSFSNCYYIATNQCSQYVIPQGIQSAALPFSFQNRYQSVSKYSVLAGGYGQPAAVSNYQQSVQNMYGKTHGQMIQNLHYVVSTAPADVSGQTLFVGSPGGVGYSGFFEGAILGDLTVTQSGDPLHGAGEPLFTSTASGTGLNSITISAPSQGSGQLGEGRPIVDTSSGVSNTVTGWSNCTNPVTTPCAASMGTTVAVSTVYGTSTTAITTLGAQSVTINSFTVGSAGSLAVGQVACLADFNDEPECDKITAVSGAAITIAPHFQHSQPIYIGIGGLSGSVMSINADNVTSATYPEITISGATINGTLHDSAWPIIGCTSTTICQVAVQGKGSWRAIVGEDKWSVSNNGVTIYPAARVLQVATNAGVDSSINGGAVALEDSTMVFTSGHTYTEFNSPAVQMSNGNWHFIYYKNNFAQAPGGYSINYDGLFVNGDCMMCLNNNTNPAWYTQGGGTYGTPYGVKLSGSLNFPFFSTYGGTGGDIGFGCPVAGCIDNHMVIHEQSSTAGNQDSLILDAGAGHGFWGLTYNNFAGAYYFTINGLEQPCLASNSAHALSSTDYLSWTRCSDWTTWANDSAGVSHQTGGTGGSTTLSAYSFNANPTASSATGTSTSASGAMGILGDDQANAVGLGASAPFRNTVYMNHVAGVTVGAGQTTSVRTANCTAMQSVFTNAAANNWKVEIPAGTYEIYCSAGLSISQTNYDQALWIKGSQQAVVAQFYANAPIMTVGDPTGGSNYSINVNIDGIRLTYGVSQTGNTNANSLVIGALRSSALSHFWIGGDGGAYTAPNTPYANPAYRAVYLPAASLQEFSNTFEDFFVQGAQYRLLDFESLGTNSWFKNWYTTNGYFGQPGLVSDSGWYMANNQGHFVNMNLESVIANTVINAQTLRGADFKSIHLESIQLTGNNPTIWVGGTNRIVVDDFDASGLYFTSATLNTLSATGSGSIFSTYQDDALTVHNLNIQLQNSGNVVNLPLVVFNPLSVGDATPTIEAFNISADDFVTGGLLANLSLDPNTPLANFAGPQRISHYAFHPGTSLVDGAVRSVSSTYTIYGQDTQPTIDVPATITSFTITLADVQAASGTGSTAIPKVGNIVHIRRLSGAASGTLTISDATAGAITTNTTSAADLYFKFDGLRYRIITDSTSFAQGGGGSNATSIQGAPVSATAPISGQALIYSGTSYVPTNVQTLLSCTAMASGVVSGPCITTAGIGSYFQYVDTETSNFTVPGTDIGALIVANGATAIALPACGTGLFIAGSLIQFTNYSASASVVVTASSSNIGAGSNTRTIAVSTGSGSTIVTHGFSATCMSSGNYAINNVF